MPVLRIDPAMLTELREYIPAAREYLGQVRPRDEVDASLFGVDKSTIRAFRNFGIPDGPLSHYNDWAAGYLQQLEGTQPFGDRAAFERWYEDILTSLDVHFEQRLQAHHRHKLADLLVKWCARYAGMNREVRPELVQYGHCPLDSKSLEVLGRLAPGTVLNRAPAMGDIVSEEAYKFAQEVVTEAASHIPCTPLEFDVIAWNIRG